MDNGVHLGSPISPALFDIYMEDVLQELLIFCSDYNFCYKLYADDLVIVANH